MGNRLFIEVRLVTELDKNLDRAGSSSRFMLFVFDDYGECTFDIFMDREELQDYIRETKERYGEPYHLLQALLSIFKKEDPERYDVFRDRHTVNCRGVYCHGEFIDPVHTLLAWDEVENKE